MFNLFIEWMYKPGAYNDVVVFLIIAIIAMIAAIFLMRD